MSDRIKENIRFYLPNDPYHHDVDNLPLRDLLDNDRKLQKQVDEAIEAAGGDKGILRVDRSGLSELRPYTLPGRPGTIFVAPGTFVARVDTPAGNSRIGAYERNTGWDGDTQTDSGEIPVVKAPFTEDSRKMNGAGRTSVIRVLKDETGQDLNATIPEWSSDDFAGESPAARVDLVYLTGETGFEDEAFSTNRAKLGVVKGAGQLANEVLARHIGKPVNEMFAYSRDDVDLDTDWLSVPMPEDIINHTGGNPIINGISWDGARISNAQQGRGFVLPVCYVIVTQNFTAGTAIPTGNIIDIRPFLRTAELSLDERQAILNSTFKPRANNPFATNSYVTNQINAIPPPVIPGHYEINGKLAYQYIKNDDGTLDTKPTIVPAGKYLVLVFGKISWETTGDLTWAIVNTHTNQAVTSPSHTSEHGAQKTIYGNADDDCWFSDCIDISLNADTTIEARGDDEVINKTVRWYKRRWYGKKKWYSKTTKKKNSINCQRMLLLQYDL